MTDLHRRVADTVAIQLAEEDHVRAVMIGGSVARGEHVASSDVDLLLVVDEVAVAPIARRLVDGLLVECVAHSVVGWRRRFDRPRTSWAYAVVEAVIVVDDGAASRLQTEAAAVLASYRSATELKRVLATSLWHGQAKLDRIRPDDLRAHGFWASLFVETMIDALYTVHDVPLPAGSRRLAHLSAVPLTESESNLLDACLTGTPSERLDATRQLTAVLRQQLGPADHEA